MSHDDLINQLNATNPFQSAWVEANAGSGKTHVLVNRIARLLLSGSAPDRLLCLTFTKAAAAEMSTRLFDQLGKWTLMPDGTLADALAEVCGGEVEAELLIKARKLFAEALESPGGLKIQTIHAFCERVLKRFPLEANVAPQFSVLDEQATDELLGEARDEVLRSATGSDFVLTGAIQQLTEFAGDEQFDTLIRNVIAERSWIANFLELNRKIGIEAGVKRELKLPADLKEESLIRNAMQQIPPNDAARLAKVLLAGKSTDVKRGEVFQAYANVPSEITFDAALGSLLTADGEINKKLMTKDPAAANPAAVEQIEKYAEIARDVRLKRNALFISQHTSNLLLVADAIYKAYRRQKGVRAALDYDDLINHTAQLFKSPRASWVLYKLDGGIDHVLVDEAQDTSPNQWSIIREIAAEFFAGIGAERKQQAALRTVFAVGDVKQSIMSFQGARPLEFVKTRDVVSSQAKGALGRFELVLLTTSFRTAPRILELVDCVFSDSRVSEGVTINKKAIVHQAIRSDFPGIVELWPVVQASVRSDRAAWDAPKDRVTADHPAVILATRIAARVVDWVRSGTLVYDKHLKTTRAMSPGDVMILVRRRGTLANEIIRQLKRNSIAVAGADRLVLSQHIAVMDLIAAGRFSLLPNDDLNLAALLRSPLCNVSEEALFALAHGRGKKSLWHVMSEQRSDSRWSEAWEFLDRVWMMADHVQPFEFYSTILGPLGGLQKMMARLGFDATDPIEEFMNAALEFGRMNTPSMERFLHDIEQSETEIKRDQDRSEAAVRVLTVHGSKGLEAPIVILPDTCVTPSHGRFDSELLQSGDTPLWKLQPKRDEGVRADARETGRKERMHEYRRLLYVALTRARDQLIVCGYETGTRAPDPERWYDAVDGAMRRLNAVQVTDSFGGEILRYGEPPPGFGKPMSSGGAAKVLSASLPAWAINTAKEERPLGQLLATGRAEGRVRARSAGTMGDSSLDRGSAIHKILYELAKVDHSRWGDIAQGMARQMLGPLLVQSVAREAVEVRHQFKHLFEGNSQGEFPVRGTVEWGGTRHKFDWRLDRVVVSGNEVLVVEFKTDRVVPQADSGIRAEYLRQLALYRSAMRGLFPGKSVKCGILWTIEPRLSVIPANYLDDVERALDP